MEVVEDLALGYLIKKKGLRQPGCPWAWLWSACAGSREFFGVVENLSKNVFAVFGFRIAALVGFVLLFPLFTLFPLAMLATQEPPRAGPPAPC